MICSICNNNKVVSEIRVIVAGRVVHVNESWLKAENWVLDEWERPQTNSMKVMTSCVLRHVYACGVCRKEDDKFEAVFTDGCFSYRHRENNRRTT